MAKKGKKNAKYIYTFKSQKLVVNIKVAPSAFTIEFQKSFEKIYTYKTSSFSPKISKTYNLIPKVFFKGVNKSPFNQTFTKTAKNCKNSLYNPQINIKN